jgi:hypothetical protein
VLPQPFWLLLETLTVADLDILVRAPLLSLLLVLLSPPPSLRLRHTGAVGRHSVGAWSGCVAASMQRQRQLRVLRGLATSRCLDPRRPRVCRDRVSGALHMCTRCLSCCNTCTSSSGLPRPSDMDDGAHGLLYRARRRVLVAVRAARLLQELPTVGAAAAQAHAR